MYTLLQAVLGKSAPLSRGAVIGLLQPGKFLQLTLTADKGKYLAVGRDIAEVFAAARYIFIPCRSWERGLTERPKRLVRDCSGNSNSLWDAASAKIHRVAEPLGWPRSGRGHQNSAEVFVQVHPSTA